MWPYIQIVGTDFYQKEGEKRFAHTLEVPASRCEQALASITHERGNHVTIEVHPAAALSLH